MYEFFDFDRRLLCLAEEAEAAAAPFFRRIGENQRYNEEKMQAAFMRAGVQEAHFAATTGYGYNDAGRDALDRVYALALGAEDALVRYNFVSGTHTLTVALFGVLRPGDRMLCVTGTPYDTLLGVIGLTGDGVGSLKEFGIRYEQVDLLPDGKPDFEAMGREITPQHRMVYIQRSRGYSLRPSLSVEEIGRIVEIAKRKAPDCIVMVDNCYGEYVEKIEPTAVGADLMAGSMIKNPGGGIAPTGGYIAGRKEFVEMCAYRLTTPGTGREIGCTLGQNREMFLGTYHAPHVTGEALKTAVFTASLFEKLGYKVTPRPEEPRADIIQAILLRDSKALIAFCRGIQKAAPVDSAAVPEPGEMPGYDSEIIMASGSFTMGSSIELSADAPLREPFAVWMQGGVSFHTGRLGALFAAQAMLEAGCLTL